MSKPVLEAIPASCIDPVLDFVTNVSLAIVRLDDTEELTLMEQTKLLKISSCLQELSYLRMCNILKNVSNGKC